KAYAHCSHQTLISIFFYSYKCPLIPFESSDLTNSSEQHVLIQVFLTDAHHKDEFEAYPHQYRRAVNEVSLNGVHPSLQINENDAESLDVKQHHSPQILQIVIFERSAALHFLKKL